MDLKRKHVVFSEPSEAGPSGAASAAGPSVHPDRAALAEGAPVKKPKVAKVSCPWCV